MFNLSCEQVGERPTGEPLVIEDMPHMASFVYDFYNNRLQAVQAHLQVDKQSWVFSSTFCFVVHVCCSATRNTLKFLITELITRYSRIFKQYLHKVFSISKAVRFLMLSLLPNYLTGRMYILLSNAFSYILSIALEVCTRPV